MSSEESKQVAARAAQALFNDHDLDQIPELFADDFVDHGAPEGAPQGPAGQRAKVAAFIAAFPDLHISYSHQIAEGDLVAGRFVLTGTHQGEFAGIAPTGNTISLEGHDLLRVENGKIVEHWTAMDSAVLMAQLGQS
jgi:steroid delta-isomerase-like uncharacterized protein